MFPRVAIVMVGELKFLKFGKIIATTPNHTKFGAFCGFRLIPYASPLCSAGSCAGGLKISEKLFMKDGTIND